MIASASLRSCLVAGVAAMISGNSSSDAAVSTLGLLVCMGCGAKLHAADHNGYGLRKKGNRGVLVRFGSLAT